MLPSTRSARAQRPKSFYLITYECLGNNLACIYTRNVQLFQLVSATSHHSVWTSRFAPNDTVTSLISLFPCQSIHEEASLEAGTLVWPMQIFWLPLAAWLVVTIWKMHRSTFHPHHVLSHLIQSDIKLIPVYCKPIKAKAPIELGGQGRCGGSQRGKADHTVETFFWTTIRKMSVLTSVLLTSDPQLDSGSPIAREPQLGLLIPRKWHDWDWNME